VGRNGGEAVGLKGRKSDRAERRGNERRPWAIGGWGLGL
jgi:hypothetical protein